MSKYWGNKRLLKSVAILCTAAAGGVAALNSNLFTSPEAKTTAAEKRPAKAAFNNGLSIFGPPAVSASWTTDFTPSVQWDHNWDQRAPHNMVKPRKNMDENNNEYSEMLEKAVPKASRHLILIRHGQYQDGEHTDEKRILTTLGREQADLTGSRLKELNYPYTLITNSTMTRAIETSNIIAKHLSDVPRASCDLLREGAPIPPEPPVGHWRPKVHQFYEDGARIEAAFRRFFHRASASQEKDSYEILVCHANVIRYMVCRALQIPPEAWLRLSLHHASITWLVVRPSGRVSMVAMGDCGHMPLNKLSLS